ncbi:MAG TPA: AsmA family protein [Terriglobales bacterium]|nr:AsmA family protein [Terriglobales bacterium]
MLIGIVVVMALVAIAALALPSLVDVNSYRSTIQAQLEQRLGRQVTLGPMHLRVIPLAFRASGVAIADDPAFGAGKVFAQADEVYVRVRVWPLLRGQVEIDALDLARPKVELIRAADGRWNFESLGRKTGAQPAARQAFSLSTLRIVDGQLAVTDPRRQPLRAVYDHIDLTLEDYAPGQPFFLEAAVHLPGEGAQKLALSGRAGPLPDGDWMTTPFEGKLNLDHVNLASLGQFLASDAFATVSGVASGEMGIMSRSGKLASSGSVRLDHPRIRGADVGFPIAADYSLTRDAGLLRIERGDLKLGATPLKVTGTVNTSATPAQLDLRLVSGDVSIEEAARLAAAFGMAFSPGTNVSGRMAADLQARGPVSELGFTGSIKARDVAISGAGLPQPVKVPAITVDLAPAAIRATEFTASTGGTSVTAAFTLTGYSSPAPRLEASVRARGAELGEALSIARAWGISAAEGMSGSGALDLDVRLVGALKNAAARSYSGTGLLERATLRLPALARPLGIGRARLRFTENSVVVEELAATVGQTRASGTLVVRGFDAPRAEFTLAADRMDLAEWAQLFSGSGPPASARDWRLVPPAYAATATPSFFSRMVGSGTLTVGTVVYDQLTLTNVRGNVTLDRGLIRMAPLNGEAYGGRASGTLVTDTRTTPVTFQLQHKLERVDANKLLSSVSSVKEKIFGLLATNGNASFAGSGQMARSLDGSVVLDLRDGKIANMDLVYEVANAAKFLGFKRTPRPYTEVSSLTGQVDLQNGVARTENLKAVISEGTLAATGSASLVDQSLNLRVTAVLTPEFSKEVGGTSVGGYLTTALANKKGELVVPLIVTGTFEKPRFAPDVEKIARMKLENLVPSLSDPGGLTQGILGAILGKKEKGEAQPQGEPEQTEAKKEPAQQPANPLEDLLGNILGQQKKKEQKPAQPPPQQPARQEEEPPEQPK